MYKLYYNLLFPFNKWIGGILSLTCLLFINAFFATAETSTIETVENPSVRIKDISKIASLYDIQLRGYGLVVGLNGTGDSSSSAFTIQTVTNMLQRFGISVPGGKFNTKNVAAVIVTADLPFFAKTGSRIDVLVSSIGDAKSLAGGTLLDTPLQAPDEQLYVLAQGPLSVGGFSVSGGAGDNIQKNHPTVGTAPNSGMVLKAPEFKYSDQENLQLVLNEPDFTTATHLVSAVNQWSSQDFGEPIARALDAAVIEIKIPQQSKKDVVTFISKMEKLTLSPDHVAEVVIDERTGTIVVGKDVRISPVAISHGNLSIQIKTEEEISQPEAFSTGETKVISREDLEVQEEKQDMQVIRGGASIDDVVRALNMIGVTSRDMIIILQAIKRAGALHAKLVIM
ncbi:flagellar basal body P-ring protein FlgI [Candidatus Poribacteria bacterium]|nr:flagellar basal body P-ring protein FlgI [Candidatus Poribacteria bacterium]